jgi:hypothetical protein
MTITINTTINIDKRINEAIKCFGNPIEIRDIWDTEDEDAPRAMLIGVTLVY